MNNILQKGQAGSFRSIREATECYNIFKKIICVSETVKEDFQKALHITSPTEVLYNTNESEKIIAASKEEVENINFLKEEVKLIGVGKLLKNKGFDRVLRITKKLVKEGYPVHTYILGEGPEKESLQSYVNANQLQKHITLLGYQLNPYKYISKCDLFICASLAEGFSTAATEALILGVPVCTVEVSGMKEMLGEHNEYGIVTDNKDECLYEGIRGLLDSPDRLQYYTHQAEIRGKDFNTQNTVIAVENMLESLGV